MVFLAQKYFCSIKNDCGISPHMVPVTYLVAIELAILIYSTLEVGGIRQLQNQIDFLNRLVLQTNFG